MKIRATHKTKMGIFKVKKSTQIAIFQKKKKRYYKGGRIMDQKKIGAFIAEMRKARQLTQHDLADIIGISDKTVSRWETGRGMPEVSLIIPLCNELGITATELLSGNRASDNGRVQKCL